MPERIRATWLLLPRDLRFKSYEMLASTSAPSCTKRVCLSMSTAEVLTRLVFCGLLGRVTDE